MTLPDLSYLKMFPRLAVSSVETGRKLGRALITDKFPRMDAGMDNGDGYI